MKRLIVVIMSLSGMLWAKPLVWERNVEYILGFYDMGLSTSFTLFDISYLSWQAPTLRWNPFAFVLTLETTVRYFPLSQFDVAFWAFRKDGVNPYLFTGIKVPHTFQAVGVPVGLGLVRSWGSFSLHGRVYGDFVVLPVFGAGWSFEFAGGLRF